MGCLATPSWAIVDPSGWLVVSGELAVTRSGRLDDDGEGISMDGDGSGPLDRDVLLPQPRLDDLPALVEQCRAAGLLVDLQVGGDQRPLPSGVELTVFRIIVLVSAS